MGKRSDFAQKLLDDLRLRKERMGAGQSSNGSTSMAGDSYTYSKRTYSTGSKEMKTSQTNGFRSVNAYNKSTGSNRSLSIEAASKQIVPFGKGRSSEPIGDLSMALAFALENGGKLRRVDSSGNRTTMLGFLYQIGRQSVGSRKTERSIVGDRYHHSSGRFPTISNLHINEIAKGAQKLNEILRACSNGINFDSYSIEIGKELLKGAVDLEESLRMLVNLQEASEYMIKPQNKNRITLLDEDEEADDDNTIRKPEHMQLDRPKFSFDKPSRNSRYFQEVAGTDLKQRLLALTYLSEATNTNHDRNSVSSSHSVSHKRSTSHGSSARTPTALSEQKNQSSSSKSKPEKGRIPNVIAKLMGLEELPENEEAKHGTQKESSSKNKFGGLPLKKSAEGSSTRERKIKDAEHLASITRKQRQTQHNHIQAIQDLHSLQAEKNLATRQTQNNHIQAIQDSHSLASQQANFEVTAQDRKPARKEKTGSRKGVHATEKKQDNAKIREQKGKEERETKNLQHMVPQTQSRSQAAVTMHKTEKRDANRLPSSHQTKSSHYLGLEQPSPRREFEPLDMKHHAGESGQQETKQNIRARKEKEREEMVRSLSQQTQEMLNFQKNQSIPVRSSADSIDALQTKVLPNNRYHEHPSQERKIDISRIGKQSSPTGNSNNDSSREEQFQKEKGSIPSFLQEKPVHLPSPQKVKNPSAQKVETPRKIDELMARRKGNQDNLTKLRKHQTSLLNEVKHRKRDTEVQETEKLRTGGSKEAEACIVKSTKLAASIQQPNELKELHFEAEKPTSLHNPSLDDAGRRTEGPETQAPNENSQNMTSATKSDQLPQELDFDRGELTSHSTPLDPLNGNHEEVTNVTNVTSLPQDRSEKVFELETPKPLSESENQLNQILIKSQLFLNTAEALFRLNIPFGILHAGTTDQHCRDGQSKSTLDTAYEVMTRKGRTQELICHPLMRMPIISSKKIRSLDELVKQTDKDLKKLEFYGRNGNVDCGVEDYLPKMIESDVYNCDPDVNSMWEFGWDVKMFGLVEKYELVKDMERFVLNGILDEVTRDLVLVF